MQTFNIVRGTGLLTLIWAGRDMRQVVFLVGRP